MSFECQIYPVNGQKLYCLSVPFFMVDHGDDFIYSKLWTLFHCNSILVCVFFFFLSFFPRCSFRAACYLWQTYAMPDLIFKPNWKLSEYLKCSFWLEMHEMIFIFHRINLMGSWAILFAEPMMNCARVFFSYFIDLQGKRNMWFEFCLSFNFECVEIFARTFTTGQMK